uniref:Uncharacterized protein n=1 Tax=Panthera leo TaxID=9689 RepID=A0A8C8W9V0_PANLE
MDSTIRADLIAAVVFLWICLLLLMLHYFYWHKGMIHTKAKGKEFAYSTDPALQENHSLQGKGDSSRKEYFI